MCSSDLATLDGESGRIAFTVVEAPPGGAVQARQQAMARVDIEDFTAFWQRTAGQTLRLRLQRVGERWDILGVVESDAAPATPAAPPPASPVAAPRASQADDEAALRARLIERLTTAMGGQPPVVATRPDPELALLDEELNALSAIPGPEAKSRRAALQAERDRLVAHLKALRFNLKGPLPMNAAIVTAGGVSLKEVDPRTMASRLVAGLHLAIGVLTALQNPRRQAGEGQEIDISLYEPLLSLLSSEILHYGLTGKMPEPMGNEWMFTAPRNSFRTADGRWVALSASAQAPYERMMDLIGRPDLKTYHYGLYGIGLYVPIYALTSSLATSRRLAAHTATPIMAIRIVIAR